MARCLGPLAVLTLLVMVNLSGVRDHQVGYHTPPATADLLLSERTTSTDRGTPVTLRLEAPASEAVIPAGQTLVTGRLSLGGLSQDPQTALVISIDMSGSAFLPAPGACGDPNRDGRIGTVLDCEINAAIALVEEAARLGSVAQIGITAFEREAASIDVSPDPGIQPLTTVQADADHNGYPDVVDALTGLRWIVWGPLDEFVGGVAFVNTNSRRLMNLRNIHGWHGGTNLEAGAAVTCRALEAAPQPHRVVIFISDGVASIGDLTLSVPCATPIPFTAFATPNRDSVTSHWCAGPPGRPRTFGTLQVLADRTGGSCTAVPDEVTLTTLLPATLAPAPRAVVLTVDDGEPILAEATPGEPPTPGVLDITATADLTPGPHTLCLRATVAEGGLDTVVTACAEVVANHPPQVDAGPDREVDEGSVIAVHAAATDPDHDPLDWTWEVLQGGVRPGALRQASLSFVALQDGPVLLRVRADDGAATHEDTAAVLVHNVPPTLRLDVAASDAAGVTVLSARLSDPGLLDRHELIVDWGDGTGPETVAAHDRSATLAHSFGRAGRYTIHAVATDDSGGQGEALQVVDIAPSTAIWGGSTSAGATVSLKAGSGTIDGRVHSNRGLREDGDWEIAGPMDAALPPDGAPDIEAGTVEEAPLDPELSRYAPGGALALGLGSVWRDHTPDCVGGLWIPTRPLSGVVYVACDAVVDIGLVEGPWTLIAEGRVRLEGAGGVLTPLSEGITVAAGSAADDALEVATTDARITGHLLAPWGGVDIEGSGNLITCAVVGDRVELSGCDQHLDGADCDDTGAVVSITPRLAATAAIDGPLSPHEEVPVRWTLRHDGADLVVSGAVGLVNQDDVTVTVRSVELSVQVWTGSAWEDQPAIITLGGPSGTRGAAGTPLQPGTSGQGVTVLPGRRAVWPAEVHIPADPTQLRAWLAPDAPPVRVRGGLGIEGPRAVRALHRFGPDVLAALRGGDGDLLAVRMEVAGLDGSASSLLLAGRLSPGETVVTEVPSTVAVPTGRRSAEREERYLQRLDGLDGADLTLHGLITATGPDGLALAAVPVEAVTRLSLPALDLAWSDPASVEAGQPVTWTWSLSNLLSAPAEAPTLTWTVDTEAAALSPLPLTLSPQRGTTGTATWGGGAGERLQVARSWSWQDGAGNLYGPLSRADWLDLPEPARVQATLTAGLLVDADGNDVISAGDTLRWTTVLTPTGPIAEATLSLPVPPSTTVVSSSTSRGALTQAGDTLTATLGLLTAPATVTLDTLAGAADALVTQGSVTGWGIAPTLTDDPGLAGLADPTSVRLISGPPRLELVLIDELVVDADRDGMAGAGDVLRYRLLVHNHGLGSVHDAVVTAPLDASRVSLLRSSTTVGTTDGVTTALGTFPGLERAVVEWEVAVHTVPFVGPYTTAQAVLDSQELSATSDDPTVPGAADPNLTPLRFVPTADNGVYPTVADLSPAEGARPVRPTAVRAELAPTAEQELVRWRVLLWPGDGTRSQATPLGEGLGAPPEVLATIDPTLLANGLYNVSVEAVDTAGLIGYADTSVWVAGDFKPGQHRTEITDATLPLPVGPVSLVRVYDTLRRTEHGDFGPGWSLELRGFKVQTNGPLGSAGWRSQVCGHAWLLGTRCWQSARPHLVAVTWPNGEQELFDFKPRPTSFLAPWMVLPDFTARPGATSRLRVVDQPLVVWNSQTTSLYAGLHEWDPDLFELVDTAGNTWRLRRGWGLERWTDLSGNTVDITADGIFSSAGPDLLLDRDPQGRITGAHLPDGTRISYSYSEAGDLAQVVDQTGNVTRYGYETRHRLTTVSVDGVGETDRLTWSGDRVAAMEDGAGAGHDTRWDLDQLTTTEVGPDPRLHTVTFYDEAGLPSRVEERFDDQIYVTETAWDEHFRPIRQVLPSGAVTETAYDDLGNVAWERNSDGVVVETVTSPQGVVLESRVGGQLEERVDVDAHGRPVAWYGGDGVIDLQVRYDQLGRVIAYVIDGEVATTVSWDSYGYLDHATMSDGRIIDWTLDAMGRITRRALPGEPAQRMTYDAAGRMIRRDDGTGVPQTFVYDPAGRLVAYTDKAGGVERYEYDEGGNITRKVLPSGDEVELSWSSSGQLLDLRGPGIERSFQWDPLGRLVWAMADGNTITRTWDDRGLQREVSDVAGPSPALTLLYDRDPAGRTRAVSGPLGRVATRYDYDLQGRLSALRDELVSLDSFQFSYDLRGRLRQLDRPDGSRTTWQSDAFDRPTAIETTREGEALAALQYSYGPDGLLSRSTDLHGDHDWLHDEQGRLIGAQHDDSSESWSFDSAWRRTAWPGHPAAEVDYDSADRLLRDARYEYAWTDNGDLASRTDHETGSVTSYSWDALHQLVEVTIDDDTAWRFSYDAEGRRVRVEGPDFVRVMVYDGDNVRSVMDESGVEVASYVTGFGFGEVLADVTTRVRYALRDPIQTPVGWLAEDGLEIEPWRSAWGERETPTEVVPFGFGGHAEDPSGMVWARARTYDPSLGMALSPDPVVANPAYLWTLGSPLAFVDPDGRRPINFEYNRFYVYTMKQQRHTSVYCYWHGGKLYIGITYDPRLKRRRYEHAKKRKNTSIKLTLLASSMPRPVAEALERYLISKLNTTGPGGLNISSGTGFKPSDVQLEVDATSNSAIKAYCYGKGNK